MTCPLLQLGIESIVRLITRQNPRDKGGVVPQRMDAGGTALQEMASFKTFNFSYFEANSSTQLS